MDEMWYYEYEVSILGDDMGEEIRRGVVCANDYAEVAEQVQSFYGTSLVKITKLFCCQDILYEFNSPDADFKIHVEA